MSGVVAVRRRRRRSKRAVIKDYVYEGCADGRFVPGARLPSQNELCAQFGVSLGTVIAALRELTHEGVIKRVNGKGTFVSRYYGREFRPSQAVGVLAPTAGHVFGPMVQHLWRGLQAHGLFAVTIDPNAYATPAQGVEQIGRLLASNPAGVLAHGRNSFPFNWLDHAHLDFDNLVMVESCDKDWGRVLSGALSDYREGGRLAAAHLIALGHRRLAAFSYGHYDRGEPSRNLSNRMWLAGCREATAAAGLDPERDFQLILQATHDDFSAAAQGPLVQALRGPNRPTAIVTCNDFRAHAVFAAAAEVGLTIPDDLALVGYFNTPWATAMTPPLTSVDIRVETLAERAVERLLAGLDGAPPRTERIAPKLVVRASCGAPN